MSYVTQTIPLSPENCKLCRPKYLFSRTNLDKEVLRSVHTVTVLVRAEEKVNSLRRSVSVITHYQQRSALRAAEAATWPALSVCMNMEMRQRGWMRTGRWCVRKPHWERYMLHTEVRNHYVRGGPKKVSRRARESETIQRRSLICDSLT